VGEVIPINEAKHSPKRQKELTTQINGKFNDISYYYYYYYYGSTALCWALAAFSVS
jgi:hypothetical protein